MYKFIAIDIDGTLLNSNGELTKKNREVIKKIAQKGVTIVLTSGRVTESVKHIASKIPVYKYMICDNGASIYDLEEEKFVYTNFIDKQTVLDIVTVCVENNIYYMVFTPKEIIVKDLKHMALAFYKKRHNFNDESSRRFTN